MSTGRSLLVYLVITCAWIQGLITKSSDTDVQNDKSNQTFAWIQGLITKSLDTDVQNDKGNQTFASFEAENGNCNKSCTRNPTQDQGQLYICNQTSISYVLDNIAELLQQKVKQESAPISTVQSLLKKLESVKKQYTTPKTYMDRLKRSVNQKLRDVREESNNLKQQLNMYMKEVSDLKVTNQLQESLFTDLVEFKSTAPKTITDLKTELRYLSFTLLDVKKRNAEINSKIPQIVEESFASVNNSIETLKSSIIQIHNNVIKKVESQIDSLRLNTSRQITDITSRVGFSAGLDGEKRIWYGPKLNCPIVTYEVGGGLNKNTGVFTSPTEGDFVFFVSIVSYYTQSLYMDIKLNGVSKVRAGASEGNDAAASNLVILHLKKGDRVWVERHDGMGYTSRAVPLMTFSGFKL